MKIFIKHLLRNFGAVFGYVSVAEILIRIATIMIKNDLLLLVHGLWMMITATGLIVLSTYYLYSFVFTRKYYFYYTLKYSKHCVVTLMASMFVVFNFIYYLLYCDFTIDQSIYKLISLIAYFAVVICLLYGYRALSSKKLALNLFLLSLIIFVVGSVVACILIISQSSGYGIGVTKIKAIKHFYVNITPIIVFPSSMASYSRLALFSNAFNLLTCSFALLLYLGCKRNKINW